MNAEDQKYLDTLLEPIRVCANYKPKFGQGKSGGLTLGQFQKLYQSDPFYAWFGLDNPLMYAAHKAAGGMTSIYRQIGIGCERLFRLILCDKLGLSGLDVCWSYQVPKAESGQTRKLSLDARIPLEAVKDVATRQGVDKWLRSAAKSLGVAQTIADSLLGVVFEVRQGYKSKDSKRQNADIANAATAYTKAYLPCAVILSAQIDSDIMLRYRAERWAILVGVTGINDPQNSTYDFMRQVIGYDLEGFFQRNTGKLKQEVDSVLKKLLTPRD